MSTSVIALEHTDTHTEHTAMADHTLVFVQSRHCQEKQPRETQTLKSKKKPRKPKKTKEKQRQTKEIQEKHRVPDQDQGMSSVCALAVGFSCVLIVSDCF